MKAKEEASSCLPPSGDVTLPCFVQNLRSGGPPFSPGNSSLCWEHPALLPAAAPDRHIRGPWPVSPETGNAERGPWSSRTVFQFSLKLTRLPLSVAS